MLGRPVLSLSPNGVAVNARTREVFGIACVALGASERSLNAVRAGPPLGGPRL